MSYSRNYSGSVPYHGTVSYSYPASQNGGSGSASYSGSVPVYVTINVNTDPFDGSVDQFNASIGALGASITAMHAAQCAAIKQTADSVSASLINGFYGTINTELSQQLQALDSAIKANFGLIQQQGKAVSGKKDVMDGDYNRISSRYMKLFADLDNECYKRIYALDKQSFALSEKVQKQLLTESSGNAAAMNLLGVEEIASSKTLMFVSSINRKVLDVIKTIQDYIAQEFTINSLFNMFLFDEESTNNIPVSIPVIWTQSDMIDTEQHSSESRQECYITDHIESEKKQLISQEVDSLCSRSNLEAWEAPDEAEQEALNREFNSLLESNFAEVNDEMTHRVYRTMLSLWYDTHLHSIKRG